MRVGYWSYQYPDLYNDEEDFVEYDSYIITEIIGPVKNARSCE